MTDLSQMFRWNAGFVRGLAQTVLARAKAIRSSLTAQEDVGAVGMRVSKPKIKSGGKNIIVQRRVKPSAKKAAKAPARKSGKNNYK